MKKGDLITLAKLSDDAFGGNHPGGIYEGYTRTGVLQRDIAIGDRCLIVSPYSGEFLDTSPVTEIWDGRMKTTYSTYSIELIQSSEEI
jgi:hypothetical protein